MLHGKVFAFSPIASLLMEIPQANKSSPGAGNSISLNQTGILLSFLVLQPPFDPIYFKWPFKVRDLAGIGMSHLGSCPIVTFSPILSHLSSQVDSAGPLNQNREIRPCLNQS